MIIVRTQIAFFASLSFLAFAASAGCSPAHDETNGLASQAAGTSTEYAYAFDSTGLSTAVGMNGSSYAIARRGDVLTAGPTTYRFDALGRIAAIDDLSMTYGPDGQIARASRGAHTVSYLYDENGERILETTDGVPTAASVDDKYITATELDEPVRVGGELVGMLHNGQFSLLASDARGTVQADTDGTQHLASPFGERAVHPDVAEAIDYAAKGWDVHLATVRMGVRDYDPRIGRFLQPDPLYLAEPERCVARVGVIDCNLYTYARNNPVQIVDPSGKFGITIGVGASGAVGIGSRAGSRWGVAASGELGILIDMGNKWKWSEVKIQPYVSVGAATPFDKSTTGAAGLGAGVGGSVNYISDPSQVWGDGKQAGVSTPLLGGEGVMTTSGRYYGGGVSVGPSVGASVTTMRTKTFNPLQKAYNWARQVVRR